MLNGKACSHIGTEYRSENPVRTVVAAPAGSCFAVSRHHIVSVLTTTGLKRRPQLPSMPNEENRTIYHGTFDGIDLDKAASDLLPALGIDELQFTGQVEALNESVPRNYDDSTASALSVNTHEV